MLLERDRPENASKEPKEKERLLLLNERVSREGGKEGGRRWEGGEAGKEERRLSRFQCKCIDGARRAVQ